MKGYGRSGKNKSQRRSRVTMSSQNLRTNLSPTTFMKTNTTHKNGKETIGTTKGGCVTIVAHKGVKSAREVTNSRPGKGPRTNLKGRSNKDGRK